MAVAVPQDEVLAARRPLGATGLSVAPIALGTMQFGWTLSDVDAMRLLDAYVALGGNLVDTANMYGGDQSLESFAANRAHVGVSEDVIGRWLATRGKRDDIVLTTKVRARMWDGRDGEGLGRAHVVRAVDDSLRRLRTDHVDVLYAHWPDPEADADEWLETFGDLVRAGKVRHAGTSNFCDFSDFGDLLSGLLARADADARLARIACEQPRFNLLNRREYERRLQAIAVRERLGIVTYSSLASGFLTGRFRRRGDLAGGARQGFVARYLTPAGLELLDALDDIGRRHGAPVAAVSLAWVLAQPGVSASIVGPDSPAELQECAAAARVALAPDDLQRLDAVAWSASDPEFVNW